MILPIIGHARSLSLRHSEEMCPTHKGSSVKQAATKKLPPKKKKNKQDDAVTVLSQIPRRRRQANQENQANQDVSSLVKTTRDTS